MKIDDLPFMPKFFDRYINLVDRNVTLVEGLKTSISVFDEVIPQLKEKANFSYKERKWSVKELLQHCIDTERVLAYRALVLSRKGNADLAGMDENVYAKNAVVSTRSIDDLINEFKVVRQSSIYLFENLGKEQLAQVGTCFAKKMTPLAIGFVIIGHPAHHLDILKERYLKKP